MLCKFKNKIQNINSKVIKYIYCLLIEHEPIISIFYKLSFCMNSISHK